MTLFEVTNNRAFPTAHALLIEPYKTIWEEDHSPHKDKAIKYFSYIELVCSPKLSNPFFSTEEKDRPKVVAKEVFKDENFLIPSELMLAVISFKDHLAMSSLSYNILVDAENGLQRLREFLAGYDPGLKTPSGALLLKPKEYILALKELPTALDKIREARTKVHQELIEADVRMRNQREPNIFEQ